MVVSANQVQEAPAVNRDPRFTRNTDTRSVAENTVPAVNIGPPVTADDTGDILTYSLGGTDADSFYIDPESGQMQTVDGLDYETKHSYSVIVSVSDGKNDSGADDPATDDTINVTIKVTNVDELGTVTLSSSHPQEGTALTARLTDPDGVSGTITWKWAKAGSTAGSFTPIKTSRSDTLTPGTGDVGKVLWAMATYRDEHGSNKTAVTVSVSAVQQAPENNIAPAFAGNTATRSVAENTAAAANIGALVTATDTDTDSGDTLTYSLGGTDAASFAIIDVVRPVANQNRPGL